MRASLLDQYVRVRHAGGDPILTFPEPVIRPAVDPPLPTARPPPRQAQQGVPLDRQQDQNAGWVERRRRRPAGGIAPQPQGADSSYTPSRPSRARRPRAIARLIDPRARPATPGRRPRAGCSAQSGPLHESLGGVFGEAAHSSALLRYIRHCATSVASHRSVISPAARNSRGSLIPSCIVPRITACRARLFVA